MLRHARAILRMTRIVIAAEVTQYQRALKDKMLADPQWRGRVFAELGGVHGMQRWQARFASHQQAGPNSFQGHDSRFHDSRLHDFPHHDVTDYAFTNHDGAKIHSRYKTDSAGQFRLAPLPRPSQPRQFLGRIVHETGERPSPFDQPIPLSPRELTPRALKPLPPRNTGTHNAGIHNASTYGAGAYNTEICDGGRQAPEGTSHKPP